MTEYREQAHQPPVPYCNMGCKFQGKDTKIDMYIFLAKNQHAPRKLINLKIDMR